MTSPVELIKSLAIEKMDVKARTHLLNANAIRKTKSLGAITGLTDLGFQIMSVEPGHEYSEYHRHLFEEQCFYILSGRGEVIIDEVPHSIGAGDFLGFPKSGLAHTIVNNSDETLTFICARTNLEQDVCDYPRQKKRLYMSGTEEALVDFKDIRIDDKT